MENNIKTFENFVGKSTKVMYSELGNNWDSRRIVNKESGLNTFVLIDRNASENRRKRKNNEPVDLDTVWLFKEYPSTNDQVLYMTDEQAIELNDHYNTYRNEEEKYRNLVDKYKSPTSKNGFHRPKGEL